MSRLARYLVPLTALGLGALFVALPGGCGRKGAGPATVRGTVTFQGEPLADGIIVFTPDPDRGGSGKPIRGDLAADGTFQLQPGDGAAIAPGWYRVAIAPPPRYHPGSLLDRHHFPADLGRPDRSKLLREVKAGVENVFEFGIELPGK